jgi:hypothetical protein
VCLTPYLITLFLTLMEPVAAPVLDVFVNVLGVGTSVFTLDLAQVAETAVATLIGGGSICILGVLAEPPSAATSWQCQSRY